MKDTKCDSIISSWMSSEGGQDVTMSRWSRCHDEGANGKQEQESVAEHAEGGVIGIPEYCPDY